MDEKTLSLTLGFIKDEISKVSSAVEKLNDKVEAQNITLVENTVVVKEHERRSLAIEGWAESFENRFVELLHNVKTVEKDVEQVQTDLNPIKFHVEKVNKIVNFINGVPVVLKVTVLVFGVLTSIYGVSVFIHELMPRK